MTLPAVTSREQWLAARKELLAREKELTRLKDALNTSRRQLPMVRIDKDYVFTGPDGAASLLDLFGPSRQLIIQHVMFDPAWDDACPSCTASVDELSGGLLRHLQGRDTAFAAVARAPFGKIAEYKARWGWDFDWYSSYGSDFNYDFHVSMDASVAPVQYNYRGEAELKEAGMGWILDDASELPGLSCFLRDGDAVFHTYSTFGRAPSSSAGPTRCWTSRRSAVRKSGKSRTAGPPHRSRRSPSSPSRRRARSRPASQPNSCGRRPGGASPG